MMCIVIDCVAKVIYEVCTMRLFGSHLAVMTELVANALWLTWAGVSSSAVCAHLPQLHNFLHFRLPIRFLTRHDPGVACIHAPKL